MESVPVKSLSLLPDIRLADYSPVDYKAVLTEHNQNWNCMQLYKELEKEHNMYHPS